MRTDARWAATIAAFAVLTLSSRAAAPTPDEVARKLGVRAVELVDVQVPDRPGAEEPLVVTAFGRDHVLDLRLHSIRADGFALYVDDGRRIVQVAAPAPRTYRGEVLVPTSRTEVAGRARASLGEGGLHALVLLDAGGSFAVEPLAPLFPAVRPTLHAVYRLEDVLPHEGSCGTDLLPPPLSRAPTPQPGPKATGLNVCEIAVDADFQFFQQNGSNVNSTLFDVENVMNGVESIYENDTQITYELTAVVVRTTSNSNPYTTNDPSGLLNEFRSEWLQNMGVIPRDVAHLFTGRNLSGSVIGIAWLNAVCTSLGYGLSQSKFTFNFTNRVALTAHELGHNWSAPHCSGSDCRIMCPTLGGCTGDMTKFGQSSKNFITSWKNSHLGCLPALPDPIALPFQDDFETGSFDPAKWTFVKGAKVNSASNNPPSGSFAMALGADGPGAFDDDEVRTVELLAGGLPGAFVRYSSEHFRVEAGEDLVVEARTNSLSWTEIDRVTSDGVDQFNFVDHIVALPNNALHDELRIRFRAEVDDTNDQWYVDDVEVGICGTVTFYGSSDVGSSGQPAVIGTTGGSPTVGNNAFAMTVTGGTPGSIAALFAGDSQKNVQKTWGTLLVGGPNFTRTLFVLDGQGAGQVSVPVTPDLAGRTRYFQFLLRDNVPGDAVQASNGAAVTFCP